jgi:hypothetical protein
MQLKLNTENNYEKLFIVTTEDESNRCNVIQMPYKANNKEKFISNTEKTRTEFYLIKSLLSNIFLSYLNIKHFHWRTT